MANQLTSHYSKWVEYGYRWQNIISGNCKMLQNPFELATTLYYQSGGAFCNLRFPAPLIWM